MVFFDKEADDFVDKAFDCGTISGFIKNFSMYLFLVGFNVFVMISTSVIAAGIVLVILNEFNIVNVSY